MIADTAVFPSGSWSDPPLPKLYAETETFLGDIGVEFIEVGINRVKHDHKEPSIFHQLSFSETSSSTSVAGSEVSDETYIDAEIDLESSRFSLDTDHEYLSSSLLSSFGETSSFSDHVSFTGLTWGDVDLQLSGDTCVDVSSHDTSSEKVPSPTSSPAPSREGALPVDFIDDNAPWSSMTYSEQLSTVEKLTSLVSTDMDLRDQLEVIKIINKDAALSPTDTEFVIDLAYLSDEKIRQVREYIKKHKSTTSSSSSATGLSQQKKVCKKQERKTYQKAVKQRQRKEYRQMMKERRSGLFKREEVLALSRVVSEPDDNYSDVDILT